MLLYDKAEHLKHYRLVAICTSAGTFGPMQQIKYLEMNIFFSNRTKHLPTSLTEEKIGSLGCKEIMSKEENQSQTIKNKEKYYRIYWLTCKWEKVSAGFPRDQSWVQYCLISY